jgi:flagellar assembly factor FliW
LKIETSRFGTLEISEEKIIRLPAGVFGFPDSQRYTLFEHKKGSPFLWLQSMDNGCLAFVLIDPLLIRPDYEVEVGPQDIRDLELSDVPDGIQTLVIVNITPGPNLQMTANLLGPIVINVKKGLGKQIVLSHDRYPLRHPIPTQSLK